MSGSVNKVTLVGNLGRDPEVRRTQDGKKIVHLSVATSESWTDRSTGERKERVEWHRVVIWNERLGEVAEKYLTKGRSVYLEGQLQTHKWQDQSGQDRYTTEVVLQQFRGELVLLGDRQGGGVDHDGNGDQPAAKPAGGRGGDRAYSRAAKEQTTPRDQGGYDDLDSEIPFGRAVNELDVGLPKAVV